MMMRSIKDRKGEIYHTVQFKSKSKVGWGHFWEFGDGYTSTETNPVHTYKRVGEFTVTLTTQNETKDFQAQVTKGNYIKTYLPKITDDKTGPRKRPTIKKEYLVITAPQASSGTQQQKQT